MENSFLVTAAVIVIVGLMNHFLIEAQPSDLLSTLHKLFPFVYWFSVATIVTIATQIVSDVVNDAMLTAAVAVSGAGIGIPIGHLVVEYLRDREERRLDDSCLRAYERVFDKEDGARDRRRDSQEQPEVSDTGRVSDGYLMELHSD